MADTLSLSWNDMALDSRIIAALEDLRWVSPTTVQSACVPLSLKGKDISIQSATGSGKTGAFLIPLIQRIIMENEQKKKRALNASGNPIGLIVVPSVELCEQTVDAALSLSKYVKPRVVMDNITSGSAVTANRLSTPHIIVSTAAMLGKLCRTGVANSEVFKHLRYFVMDEADLVVSSAEHSIRAIQSILPSSMQVILSSATLTEGVASIKGHLLRNPTNIVLTTTNDDLPADSTDTSPFLESRITLKDTQKKSLHQYYLVATDECHRHTLIYALYRMALIPGKTLIFLDDAESTYKLQHFLEQLGVATIVYDSNLPMNVRLDSLKQFQTGRVSTLICTDGTLESIEQLQTNLDLGEDDELESRRQKKKARKTYTPQAPSSLHRGIDFHKVRNVILFDGVDATSSIALSRYTHRIGRAGRSSEEGLAITFFTIPQAKRSISLLRAYCQSKGLNIAPFRQLIRQDAAKLQYRVDSVLSNITRTATRKLRVATVAAELEKSSYLSNHLSSRDNETLHRILKRSSKSVKVEKDLLDVPEYMNISGVDRTKDYTKRVKANHTRAQTFKMAAKKSKTADPLKNVVRKIKAQRSTGGKK